MKGHIVIGLLVGGVAAVALLGGPRAVPSQSARLNAMEWLSMAPRARVFMVYNCARPGAMPAGATGLCRCLHERFRDHAEVQLAMVDCTKVDRRESGTARPRLAERAP